MIKNNSLRDWQYDPQTDRYINRLDRGVVLNSSDVALSAGVGASQDPQIHNDFLNALAKQLKKTGLV